MSVPQPLSISYGGFLLGGSSSDYQLDGSTPYVIERSFETLRIAANVIAVGSDEATLFSLSDAIETQFRLRDQDFEITIGVNTWTFTAGSTALNVRSSITKTGDPATDRGVSRSYTVSIEAELPADDGGQTGLRDISYNVAFEPGRQRVVTVRGVYTADTNGTASENYLANADAEVGPFLTALGGTYELVDESYERDRRDATCQFARQYVELLFEQAQGTLDDPRVREHHVTFTELHQQPGDSGPEVHRLRRVVATYDCAVDIDVTTDLASVYESVVKPHLRATFERTFLPVVFAVEDNRTSYDETAKRVSISTTFVFQSPNSNGIVEATESATIREARQIDYTPHHNGDELNADVDPGWATVERITNRTVVFIGSLSPRYRIGDIDASRRIGSPFSFRGTSTQGGFAFPSGSGGGSSVRRRGWNIVGNTSQVTPRWIGDPNEEQIQISVLTEEVVERWTQPGSSRNRTI